MKLAFADVYGTSSDAGVDAASRRADCSTTATSRERVAPHRPEARAAVRAGKPPSGGTIYLSAADERGMMVSFIQSNYMGFGSGVVVPGWGVSMQNRGHGFVARRGEPELRRAGQAARSTPSSRPSSRATAGRR